jgi:hypothetical protein
LRGAFAERIRPALTSFCFTGRLAVDQHSVVEPIHAAANCDA